VPRQIHEFDPPDRFVAGTVGQPGQRTFFLQASASGRVVSVALEKVQVSVLAERLGELLDEVRRRGGDVPSTAAGPGADDVGPLDQPIMEEFRVGTLALAWDSDNERVIVEARAVTEDEDDAEPLADDEDETGPDLLRVHLTPDYARAFVKRALRVVAAGRPPCPFCGLPLDPEGHVCPRQNGHRH
jgi:uncharacterized repeat protein (TIGR03847 family)